MKNFIKNQTVYRKSFAKKGMIKSGITVLLSIVLSFSAYAQTGKITISLSDVSIETVIDALRNQTDINFIYNHEEISKCPNVTVHVKNGTVVEVLTQCFKNSGFTYQNINGTIIITPKKEVSTPPSQLRDNLTQTLRGRVIDRDSKASLPFANVVIANIQPMIGTTTDMEGKFKFTDLPVGRHTVIISYLGYEDAVLSEILVGSAKEVVLTVEISEKASTIDELTISVKKDEPLNSMATVSARSFSVEETKRYAASISDPARMALTYAGVSSGEDASNEIIIRGNSPNWMSWRLEGVEIPSPNHFAEEGFTSGYVSILSSNLIGTSDFYTGAFPAEYGGALSGVFDIKLRNGNNEKREYTFQAGLLGFDISAEGPFKKDYSGSFLFNYRYSTFSLMNNLGIEISQNSLPAYQDLSFKVNLPTKKAGTFSLWGIGGLSSDDQKFLPDTSKNEFFDDGYTDFTETGMYATGLSHMYFIDKKSYIKTVISSSMSSSGNTVELMDTIGILHDNYKDKLQNSAIRINTLYNRKLSSKLTVRAGVTFNELKYDYLIKMNEDDVWNTFLNSDGNTELYQGYLQSKFKFTDKIILTAGVHYAHFALSKDNALEPRAGLQFILPHRQKLSFGYGIHSKNENLPVYFVEHLNPDGSKFYPNKSLEMTQSTHYVVGYDKMFGNDLLFKTEAYYQEIDKLPVPTNPNEYWAPIFGGVNQNDTLANIGEGRNYGLEFTIQKFFTNNYYFLITSSLFDSKYKAADGVWRNTKYNINYINNFIAGKEMEWGDNKLVGLNAKIIWSGGKRMIPIDYEASVAKGEGVYLMDELYSIQAKDYFRTDIGVSIHFFKEKAEHVLSLDIQNVTNRQNVLTQVYDKTNEKIVDYPLAGLIPILNYRIEF